MTNTTTDADKYIINGTEVTPTEAIEIITMLFNKQQFLVGKLNKRIAELETAGETLAQAASDYMTGAPDVYSDFAGALLHNALEKWIFIRVKNEKLDEKNKN